jgi:hypothetical protein
MQLVPKIKLPRFLFEAAPLFAGPLIFFSAIDAPDAP